MRAAESRFCAGYLLRTVSATAFVMYRHGVGHTRTKAAHLVAFGIRLNPVCGCILSRDAECVKARRWIMMLMDKTDSHGNRYVVMGEKFTNGTFLPMDTHRSV